MWQPVICGVRSFSTHTILRAKMGRVMNKVLGQTSKKKRVFSEAGILPNAEMFSKGSYEGKYSGSSRRVSVLNKLFMKYITDILATGEYSSEFVGQGIEITRVQISPDYTGLNVFWISKNTLQCDEIEKLLKKNAGFLRHELSSLRVMGAVPLIQFVKDKQYFQIMEVDTRLAKADFGEDHVSTIIETKLKTDLEIITPLPFELKNQVEKLDEEANDDSNELPMPPMPHDVLGLNHAEVLNKIKRGIKKSKALHRFCNQDSGLGQTVNENPVEFTSNKERRKSFKEFLAKRELLRSKTRKMERNYTPDLEFLEEEFKRTQSENFKNFNSFEDEEDIIEDVD